MATTIQTMASLITVEVTRECPLFEIDFEEGDVSDFTSTVDPDGEDVHANAEHALANTVYGGEFTIDDSDVFYGEYKLSTAVDTGVFRIRMYINFSDLNMINGDDFVFFAVYNNNNNIFAQLHMTYDGSKKLKLGVYDDEAIESLTSAYTFSNYIEFKILKETTNGANDGSGQLWIDGVDKQTLSSIGNYTIFSSFWYIRVGMISGRDAGTEGHYVADQITANVTGTQIGAR